MKKILFYTLDKNLTVDPKYFSLEPDLIVVYGGDGTLISAIKKLAHLNVPFYGVAGGTLNFLMNPIEKGDKLKKILKRIEEDKVDIDYTETPLLNVYLNNQSLGLVVNDVVVGESLRSYSTIEVKTRKDVSDSNQLNKQVKCSAIVVCTPLGSTAFNKNNYGRASIINKPIWQVSTVVADTNFRKELDESIEDTELTITKFDSSYETMILIDNIRTQLMHQNDVLTFEKGQNITLGFDDINAFNMKRIGV